MRPIRFWNFFKCVVPVVRSWMRVLIDNSTDHGPLCIFNFIPSSYRFRFRYRVSLFNVPPKQTRSNAYKRMFLKRFSPRLF